MKTFVALTVVTLLSFSSASISPDQAKADVVAYVEPKIFNLLSIPGVTRAGGGIKCYDKYLPLITAATEDSKTDTEACIARADSRREDELNKVKTERENLDSQVHSVEETLSGCLNKTDDLEYLRCLQGSSANLQNTISEVGKTSSSLSDNLSLSYKNIDNTEDACVKSAIAKAKLVSDELLASLQNCLMNGLDNGGADGSSETGSGDSDGESNGGSDGGSEGSSDGSSDTGTDEDSDAESSSDSSDLDSGSDNGSDGSSDGNIDSESDSGSVVVPNPDTMPEEDIES